MRNVTIAILLLMLGISHTGMAQNSIDELVDHYSGIGESTFTSTVVRDPETRQITKVVKTLKVVGTRVSEFVKAFEQEAKKNDTHTSVEGIEKSVVITSESPTANRIYMLKYNNYVPHILGKTTIIIKYNKKP